MQQNAPENDGGRLTRRQFVLRASVSVASFVPTLANEVRAASLRQRNSPSSAGTPGRRPDIDGVWIYGTATPLERPQSFAGQSFFRSDSEAEAFRALLKRNRLAAQERSIGAPDISDLELPFVTRGGRKPTSVIFDPADGRIPFRDGQQISWLERFDSYTDLPLSERCIRSLIGPPFFPNYGQLYLRIVQTDKVIAIAPEALSEVRLVSLDGPARTSRRIRSWVGEATGQWRGEILVIETRNFRDQRQQRIPANRFDENLRVIERLYPVGNDLIWYEFTVDDPTVFLRPWSGRFPLERTHDLTFEVACHEGNYSLPNILRGARELDRRRGFNP